MQKWQVCKEGTSCEKMSFCWPYQCSVSCQQRERRATTTHQWRPGYSCTHWDMDCLWACWSVPSVLMAMMLCSATGQLEEVGLQLCIVLLFELVPLLFLSHPLTLNTSHAPSMSTLSVWGSVLSIAPQNKASLSLLLNSRTIWNSSLSLLVNC